ncbi:MAG: hypothetical protein K4571_15155 [Deltaproteobacteria bacterium]
MRQALMVLRAGKSATGEGIKAILSLQQTEKSLEPCPSLFSLHAKHFICLSGILIFIIYHDQREIMKIPLDMLCNKLYCTQCNLIQIVIELTQKGE